MKLLHALRISITLVIAVGIGYWGRRSRGEHIGNYHGTAERQTLPSGLSWWRLWNKGGTMAGEKKQQQPPPPPYLRLWKVLLVFGMVVVGFLVFWQLGHVFV